MIKRRSFLGYFSIGWLTACFPVVLAACAPKQATTEATSSTPDSASDDKTTSKPAAKKTADGFTVVGTVAQLEQAGYIQTKQVAVTKDPANPKQLLAVNPKCTHQGCDVKWMAGAKKYDCPCHSAEYAADGKVLKGPATKSLAKYPAKIVGTQVLVKV
ncbi:ubiquinol-cytochrome c reductase iron-sulfur subunit [Chamaesiphon minutus]|uniref:Rieske Fe-S protein n=1 Tax=Chamaesiphon minutus (strain ATCC 27169 / PCC 6605) TaxID=1173020 RepID=K9UAY3_CHAP6|nr:ubiquinol-cytochrome c reductase iron-sulfur subunit [Chamaesiphon minutus]AFY91768.1 Rieske Fe-S protein [Chamaesiphon minutus PCC 6605]